MSALVPVTTWLKGPTFRAYEQLAEQRHTSVGVLLAMQADLSVQRGGRRLKAKESDERDEQVRRLHAQGLSDTKIARRLGITPQAVGPRRRKLGLPRLYGPFGEQP